MKLTKKKIESLSEMMFQRLAYGVQFSVFDLGKVCEGAETILRNGGTIEDAEKVMVEAISKYRKN